MMHKKLEREIVVIEFGFLFYRGIKIWKKVIRYVVQNNRKCLQKSSSLRIHPAEQNSFYCIQKIDSGICLALLFFYLSSNEKTNVMIFNKQCDTRPKKS